MYHHNLLLRAPPISSPPCLSLSHCSSSSILNSNNGIILGFHVNIQRGKRLVKGLWSSPRWLLFAANIAATSSIEAGASSTSAMKAEGDVLKALSEIIDPDFGTDIVSCGFVKDLQIKEASGEVAPVTQKESFSQL